MFALRRPALFVPLLITLAAVIVGALAVASRGPGGGEVQARAAENCPPVARNDADFTLPGEPVSIDVLANDTDPDGDPLVLDTVGASHGSTSVDDGGTPTDASDDRLLYTPGDTAEHSATLKYRIEDPAGATSTAEAVVAVAAAGVLPEGMRSASIDDPGNSPAEGRCAKDATEAADEVETTTPVGGPPTSRDDLSEPGTDGASTAPKQTSGGKAPSGSGSTTTVRRNTTTTRSESDTPGPASPSPTAPAPTGAPTTTRPPSNDPPPCDYNDSTGQSCRDYANNHRSTTTQP